MDLYAPAMQQDRYPAYDELREEAPVHCMPGTSTYVLTRYEDVAWVSKRTDLFANGPAPGAALLLDAEALSTRGAEQQRPLITWWSTTSSTGVGQPAAPWSDVLSACRLYV